MDDDVTFDRIRTWKVDALKEFLKKRDLKVSGRKEELVARVFAAIEQKMPVCLQAEERVLQTKYEQKSLLSTPEGILSDPLTLKDGWIKELEGMIQWPPIFLSHITMYIMRDHPGNDVSLQKRLLNEYKEGKAYRMYEGGWLKEIHINLINERSKYCFMKAQCTPSMKINDVPHKVWICAAKETGDIQSAYCSCTAGLGGSCAHITAMFFRIEAAVRSGYTNPACTSKLCAWNVPAEKTKVEPVRVKDMNFKAAKFNKVSSRSAATATRKLFTPFTGEGTKAEESRRHMHDELKELIPNGCFAAFFEREKTRNTADVPAADNLAPPLPSDNLITKLADDYQHVDKFLSALPTLAQSVVDKIEQETIGQASNPMWMLQRKGRITASNFYSVFTRINTIKGNPSKDHDIGPLVKKVMGYVSYQGNIPALKHGQTFEPVAKEKYLSLVKCKHQMFNFRECGLFVDPDKIYLGASPDLLVYCECCGSGVVEFKCPYSIAQESPSADNLKYLVTRGNETKLNEDHAYFAQIQGQLALAKRDYCDFFVFTHVGHFMQRIYFDNIYWAKLVSNLDYFFHNYLAQELVHSNIKHHLETSSVVG